MNNYNLNIDPVKVAEMYLSDKYNSEFEVIDGLNQHPQGINYYTWLYRKGLITKEKWEEIQQKIKEEFSDEDD